ncbi:hypothetical protein PRZ48_012553 [Zasmidium cellare]|uniref:Uncharacterized protein n=1 Tax=Zasmidium cellare TaxID=395010 RepID=A0ABR0E649_ZASCE|nr:hypothetical protein PRZ48_012553 [Zasmidium cellare]
MACSKRDLIMSRTQWEFGILRRIFGTGSWIVVPGLAVLGMALTIPDADQEAGRTLSRPVWASAALTNDVQSFEKKKRQMQAQAEADMVNAVWVVKKLESIDEEAKARVLHRADEFADEYVETLKVINTNVTLSRGSRVYLEAMQYMISGDLVWGWSAPRYWPEIALDLVQIARLTKSKA